MLKMISYQTNISLHFRFHAFYYVLLYAQGQNMELFSGSDNRLFFEVMSDHNFGQVGYNRNKVITADLDSKFSWITNQTVFYH